MVAVGVMLIDILGGHQHEVGVDRGPPTKEQAHPVVDKGGTEVFFHLTNKQLDLMYASFGKNKPNDLNANLVHIGGLLLGEAKL